MDLRIITNNINEFNYTASEITRLKEKNILYYDIMGIFGRGSSGLSNIIEHLQSNEVTTITLICDLFNLSATISIDGWRYDCSLSKDDKYRQEHLIFKVR